MNCAGGKDLFSGGCKGIGRCSNQLIQSDWDEWRLNPNGE